MEPWLPGLLQSTDAGLARRARRQAAYRPSRRAIRRSKTNSWSSAWRPASSLTTASPARRARKCHARRHRRHTQEHRGFRPPPAERAIEPTSASGREATSAADPKGRLADAIGASSIPWLLRPKNFAIRDPGRRDRLSLDELRPKARSTNCIENLLRVFLARVVIYDARVPD